MQNLIRSNIKYHVLKNALDSSFNAVHQNDMSQEAKNALGAFYKKITENLQENAPFRALIVDDSDYKVEGIRHELEALAVADIAVAGSVADMRGAVAGSMSRREPFDIIILDMQFPRYRDSAPEIDAGRKALGMLEHMDAGIPVVLCSSDEIDGMDDLKSEYGFLLGSMMFDSSVVQNGLNELKTFISDAYLFNRQEGA